MAAGLGMWMCSPGCPKLSFPAWSVHPRGCVLGQGLCCLPGTAIRLPGELTTAKRGEAMGGRSDPWQGRVLLLHGSGLLIAPDHPHYISKGIIPDRAP